MKDLRMYRRSVLGGLVSLAGSGLALNLKAQTGRPTIDDLAAQIEPQVIRWRRDIHQHPELSNREFRTSALVAAEMKRLGFEVREKVAHTGVLAVLKGTKPGPVIALRADMDALPVLERTGLPFASQVKGEYNGAEVPVAHACGHDAHVAMLLGAANVLKGLQGEITGQIVFIFQPAEEGPPQGETGGASLMIEQGVLDHPPVDAVFGLHVMAAPAGVIGYRPEGMMASNALVEITLKGRQTHGAEPWMGDDLSALAAAVITAVNQISARQINVAAEPTVLSISTVNGGIRPNIMPEQFVLRGTLRTFSEARTQEMAQKVTRAVQGLAEAYGATAEVKIEGGYSSVYNDPELTRGIYDAMVRAAGSADKVNPDTVRVTASEDFAEYQKRVPGVFALLGVADPALDPAKVPGNHSPYFDVHEPALITGVRAHAQAALYLATVLGGHRGA